MDLQELMLTATRALAIYLLMLIVIRALGKRTVGNFAAFDLVVALMLGEVVDEIVSAGGIMASTTCSKASRPSSSTTASCRNRA